MHCLHYSVEKLMLRCNVFAKITYEKNENEIAALKSVVNVTKKMR